MAWKFYLKYLLLCEAVFLPPGPYPGEPLFPAMGSQAPGGGNAAWPGRPGGGNCLAIGPAAPCGLVWWQYQEPQQGSRAEFRLDAGPASYPREVLRGERPKWLFVHFGHSKWTPAERPRLGRWSAPEKSEKHQLLHQKAWAKVHRDFSICAPWGLAIQAGVWYTAIVSRVV